MESGRSLGRKWWKDWVGNRRNLIQRMAEFRGWKIVDLWHEELGIVIKGCI